jgi:hypothetical protein
VYSPTRRMPSSLYSSFMSSPLMKLMCLRTISVVRRAARQFFVHVASVAAQTDSVCNNPQGALL